MVAKVSQKMLGAKVLISIVEDAGKIRHVYSDGTFVLFSYPRGYVAATA